MTSKFNKEGSFASYQANSSQNSPKSNQRFDLNQPTVPGAGVKPKQA